MKKTFALLLSIMLFVTVLVPGQVFAQYDKELEAAITRAKTLFDISDTYDKFEYYMNKQGDITNFSLSWNNTDGKDGSVNVYIDSNGKVLYYYSYKPDFGREYPKLPTVSKEKALETAKQFIHRINPDAADKVRYIEEPSLKNINEREYYFNFIRVENDIPFYSNSITVSVNSFTGDVNSYQSNWTDDAVFPDPAEAISLEKAQELFAEKLGLKLLYKTAYEGSERRIYLAYSNVHNGSFIDAKTGEVIDGNNIYYTEYAMNEKMMARDAAIGAVVPLSPQEREAVDNTANLISEKEAEKAARKALNISSSLSAEYVHLSTDWDNPGDYIWGMEFINKKDTDSSESISISIDAKTSEIRSFYRYVPYDEKAKVKYDEEQCLKIAENFIKKMQPAKFSEVEYTNWNGRNVRPLAGEEKPRQYFFTFTRKVNDAYFTGNGFNISVDATTGAIRNYDYSWYKKELPSAENVIGLEKAHEILFSDVQLEMQYIADYNAQIQAKIAPVPREQLKPEIKLVYGVKPVKPSNIDANSGKLLDSSGKVYEEAAAANYTDIEGHYAEEQINLLAEYGISLPDEEFKPDSSITQRDFLYLLFRTVRPYRNIILTREAKSDEEIYRELMNAGIVEEGEKAPDSVISRQDAVKFIVRALGYGKVAKIKGIYSVPFKDAADIDPELYGYVAVAYGLNIIKGNNGSLNPAVSLTRGAAAVMIYNFLNVGK